MKLPEDGRGGALVTLQGLPRKRCVDRPHRKQRPEDQAEIDAWARRAAMANGFGDAGIEISSSQEPQASAEEE